MKHNIRFFICLSIIFVIILVWLIAPLFLDHSWKGEFQIINPDSLLFARELEQSLLKGEILDIDNYAAFPYETKTGFAPFYMYFLVTFVNLVFFLFPKLSIDPLYIASCLPIIIPWLTTIFLVISIYKLTKDKILTLFCALGMLPSFSVIMISGFFNLDYDYLINFFIWLWLTNGAFYIKKQKNIFVYIGAVTTALFISTWTGSPFFYFFVTLYAFILWLKSPKSNSSFLTYASVSMLIGSIVALIFVPRNEDTYRYFLEMNVGRYSFIQGILVLVGAVFLGMLNKISDYSNNLKIPLNPPLKKGANIKDIINKIDENPRKTAFLILGVFAFLLVFFFHENLLQASGIIFQKDPVHSTISELDYGISLNNIHYEGLKDLLFRYGFFLIIFPFCFLFDSKLNKRKELKLILNWLLIFITMAIFYQIRYIRWMGCGYGLLFGFSVWLFWDILKKNVWISTILSEIHNRNKNRIATSLSKPQNVNNISLIKVAIAILPLIFISIIANYSYNTAGSHKLSRDEVDLFNYMIENTPKTSGYSDKDKPEYGILAYWDQGNKIAFYTKRPVAVSNSLWGYKTMADIFSSENEIKAFDLCKKLRMKYIVIDSFRQDSNQILSYWKVFNNMPQTPEYKLYYSKIPQNNKFDYFYFWLKDHLGLTPLGDFYNTSHFRIVFANKNDGKTISRFILYERVEGAVCKFIVEPKSKISISMEFKLSEMPFIYKINKNADENGVCTVRLPYSNDYKKGNITIDPFYKVSIEKDSKKTFAKLVIFDEDVVDGKNVNLSKQLEVVSDE